MLSWFRHAPFTFWLVAVVCALALGFAAWQAGQDPQVRSNPILAAPDPSVTADRTATMALRTSMVELLAIVRDGADQRPWAAAAQQFARDAAAERSARVPGGDMLVRGWELVAVSAGRLAELDPQARARVIAETRVLASHADALVILTSPGGLDSPVGPYLVDEVPTLPATPSAPAPSSSAPTPSAPTKEKP